VILERFWQKVEINTSTDCWTWRSQTLQKKGRFGEGYGLFWFNGRTVLAHRYSYQELVGPIPAGLTLDHLCRNRSCVRPSHLEPVTQAENNARRPAFVSFNAAKTHCPHGHEYTSENTYIRPGTAWRMCRTCIANRQK
jgi:hypothetical protein